MKRLVCLLASLVVLCAVVGCEMTKQVNPTTSVTISNKDVAWFVHWADNKLDD